ncbi:MAG: HlyD family efflux transporter periplasmic adaptor subunit [Spirochaetota bacterium]
MSRDHAGPILADYKPEPPGAVSNRRRALVALGLAMAGGLGLWFFLGNGSEKPVTGWTEASAERGSIQDVVQVSGSVEMPFRRNVLSPEEGTLALRTLAEGEWTPVDSVIARVEAPDLIEAYEEILTSIASAERELAGLDLDRSFALEREAIEQTRKRRATADADTALQRARELEAAGAGTPKESADCERTLLEARETVTLGELSVRESAQSYAMQRANLLDRLASLGLSRTDYQSRIAALDVKTPLAGRILSWKLDEGDMVARYGALATVADTTRPEARFSVPETTAPKLAAGMEVSISVGSSSYKGTIASVGLEATASTDLGSTVTVTATFEGKPPELTAGTTAGGEILLGEKADAVLLPRGPYLSSGSGRYVYVVEDDYAVRKPVTFGITRGSIVEVSTGINYGDRIITSDYGPFAGLDRVRLGGNE